MTDADELDLTGTRVTDLSWVNQAAALRVLRLIGTPAAGQDEARALAGRGLTVID